MSVMLQSPARNRYAASGASAPSDPGAPAWTMRPPMTTTTWSASRRICSRSCVTQTTGTRTRARRAGEVLEREAGGGVDRRRDLVHEHDLGTCRRACARGTRAAPRRPRARARRAQDRGLEADALELARAGRLVERRLGDLEVLEHRPRERRRSLEDHADASAQLERIERLDVHAPIAHLTADRQPRGGCSTAAASTSRSRTARPGP